MRRFSLGHRLWVRFTVPHKSHVYVKCFGISYFYFVDHFESTLHDIYEDFLCEKVSTYLGKKLTETAIFN